MKNIILIFLLLNCYSTVFSQKKKTSLSGMYIQWGYNVEWYSRSNIHFKQSTNGVDYNFTIYKARAHNRPDFDALINIPLSVFVPQYNYRVGFYLNKKHTRAIEINYDHTKYVLTNDQRLHAKGTIGKDYFDTDTSFTANQIAFEHTNGANFYQINYVRQYALKKNSKRTIFSGLWKAGAGILVPKTDITLNGKRIDNRFHIAGYCIGLEGGARWYLGKRIFLEAAAKTGFANYSNSLALGGGRVNHSFTYFEVIWTVGYDIKF